MLFYPAALPLSSQTLTCTAGVIRRHRARAGSPWRKLNLGHQALLVLAYLRKGETFADVAAGVRRRHRHRLALRHRDRRAAGRALPGAAGRAGGGEEAGHACVVIDGTLVPIDRIAADRPFYSGKHRQHRMNLQVISASDGEILWVSGPLPGATHDLTAARIWGILRDLAASGLIVLADKGYTGAGDHVRVPYRGRGKPVSQKAANRAHAQLKTWRVLRKLRCCPWLQGSSPKRSTSFRSARPVAEQPR
jgi:DDE superfamily endonuclease